MDLSWKQTSPGRFERSRGFMGSMYHQIAPAVGDPNRFGPSSTIKFSYGNESNDSAANNVEASLWKAWSHMLHLFPTLVAFSEPEAVVVEIPDPATWLSNTFLVHENQSSTDLLSNPIKYRTATLHYFPSSQEVTLDIDHQFIDGRGFAYFWDVFFSTLQSLDENESNPLDAESIKSRLPRSMEDMMGVPPVPTERGEKMAQEIMGKMGSEAGVPICMHVDVSKQPSTSGSRLLKLDEETSSSIFEAAKAKGYTVTAVTHASVILAIQDIQRASTPDSVGNTFMTNALFDMRKHYSPGFNPRDNPIVGCHCALPSLIKTEGRDLGDIAAELTAFYRAGFDNPAFKDIWREAFPPMARLYGEAHSGGPPSTLPEISSIGKLDDFMKHAYGPWKIEDFSYFISLHAPSVAIFVYTWRGNFTMKACFNDAYYGTADIDALLRKTREQLLQILGG